MWLLIWQMLLSIPIRKVGQKVFAFTWDGQQYTFMVLLQSYLNSPAVCYNIAPKDLDHLGSAEYHIGYYIGNIRSDEYQVANALETLRKDMHFKGWEKFYRVSGACHFVEVFRGPLVCGMLKHPLKGKVDLFHLMPPTSTEPAECLVGFFMLSPRNTAPSRLTGWHEKLPALNEVQGRKGLQSRSRLWLSGLTLVS